MIEIGHKQQSVLLLSVLLQLLFSGIYAHAQKTQLGVEEVYHI